MNRTLRSKLAIASIFALIIFIGISSSFAEPEYTSECGDCHTVNGSYTMSSNSSGLAKVGVPFTLRIVAQKPNPGGMIFYLSVQNGWADNNNFTFTPEYILDNSAGDLTMANFIVTHDFTFTPTVTGNQTIRAWCAINGGSQFLDMEINVTTIALPTIDSPPDQQIDEGNMTASVTWTGTSPYPDRYEVYDNSGLFDSGPWDGSPIAVGLDTLSVGSHNLTCVVYDDADQTAADQVDVLVVDEVLPIINHLTNSTVAEGPSEVLTWTPSDANPSKFEVYREGALIDSGDWGGGNIVVPLAGLPLGEYNFTTFVNDTSGNPAQDTTFVTITDDTDPSIDNPADIEYALGDTGESIEWNVTELNPDTFTIYRNDSILRSLPWSGELIIESVDGLAVGYYNFTILVNDTSGNWNTDYVNVTVVVRPEPTIDHPIDQDISEGATGYTIEWTPDDLDPERYEIYENSILVKSGLWNSSSETIIVFLDGLAYGVYDYEIIVYDVLDNSANDFVRITIYDGTAPTIDTPSDIIIDEGDVGQNITWSPDDLNPVSYEIFVDGVLIQSGLWNSSSETMNASCDGLLYGTHVFIIYVTDIGDSTTSDEVVVTVLDGTVPIIDSPLDIVYNVSTTGHNINWTPSDAYPVRFSLEINEVVVLSGGWDGTSILINVDYLSVGTYEYTLTVTDIGGNTQSDIVIVTVNPEATSTTTTTTTTTTETTTTTTAPLSPEEIEELQEVARFGFVILAMGGIAGIFAIGLILDRWRK